MEQTGISTPAETRVAIVADDLIWASRLRAAVQNAGAEPVGAKAGSDIGERFVVIDLGGRTYDGIAAVREAASAGAAVLAVGQHDDIDVRKAALAAGAKRVLSYNKLFMDGPGVIGRFVAGSL